MLLFSGAATDSAALAAEASSFVVEQIRAAVFVSMRAMGSFDLLGGQPFTAKDVLPVSDWLKMFRVGALWDPAEVIKHQSVRDGANEMFIHMPMNGAGAAFASCLPITLSAGTAHPQPTSILLNIKAFQQVINRVLLTRRLALWFGLCDPFRGQVSRSRSFFPSLISRGTTDLIAGAAAAKLAVSKQKISARILMPPRAMCCSSTAGEAAIASQYVRSLIYSFHVAWIYAGAIMAQMINNHIFGNRAVHALEHDAMNGIGAPVANQRSITAIPLRSGPNPTARSVRNYPAHDVINRLLVHT
jgi:hypothetical protein